MFCGIENFPEIIISKVESSMFPKKPFIAKIIVPLNDKILNAGLLCGHGFANSDSEVCSGVPVLEENKHMAISGKIRKVNFVYPSAHFEECFDKLFNGDICHLHEVYTTTGTIVERLTWISFLYA